MPIWTDSNLVTLAQQAEENIAMELPCITDRISLAVTSGQSLINLPDYVIDIVSITWKGYYLDPYPMSFYTEAGSGPTTISSSKPRYYLYSGYGARTIKLIPTPNETLAASSIPLSTKAEIALRLVIECKRLPDVTTSSKRIPSYYRRRLVKDWVCSRAFRQEGNGQNLSAAEYYKNKFNITFGLVKSIHEGLFISKRYEMQPQMDDRMGRTPPRPQLPVQFGRIVD